MNSSLMKSRIFSILALGLLLYFFVIPAVLTHDVVTLAQEHKINKISPVAQKVWNYYKKGRYVNPATPKGLSDNLMALVKGTVEIGSVTAPIWYVALEAPNYPKTVFPHGIPVYYHFDGFSGNVFEMNTINHFIGMDPMHRGAPYLRMLAPYALVFTALVILLFTLYNSKILSLLMLIPVALPLVFLGFYTYWLYWFGHHMHNWGAFHIKPFTPTVFGDGKVAQFTTHSFPSFGFWLLVAISIISLLAIVSKSKALKSEK